MAQSPCPHRIVDDMGYAFCMGSIGGGVWHTFKGWRNAPRGLKNRITGSCKAVSSRAPILGGNFAVWGLCFSTFDCIYLHSRRKDDPLNAIAAGASTGALLAWRAGLSSMTRGALFGGIFLAVIEGLGLMLQKAFQPAQQKGPISPYSTYKPAGPGRHVGDLDAADTALDIGDGTNIAVEDNWISNDGIEEDFGFDMYDPSKSMDQLSFGHENDEDNMRFG